MAFKARTRARPLNFVSGIEATTSLAHGAPFSRAHWALTLVVLLGGCGLPTFQELTGQADPAPAPPQQAAPVAVAPPAAVAPVEVVKPDPKLVIENFKKVPRFELNDGHLAALASLEEGLDELTSLNLSGASKVTKEGLKNLEKMGALTELDMSSLKLEEGALDAVAKIPRLEKLSLQNMGSTGGIASLVGMEYLLELSLNKTPMSDEDWTDLGRIKSLENLHLEELNVTDDNIAKLTGLSNLKRLDINQNRITDPGCKYLSQMASLEYLRLSRSSAMIGLGIKFLKSRSTLKALDIDITNLQPPGYAQLKGWSGLEHLSLSDTSLNDAMMPNLIGCVNLKELYLRNTALSSFGMQGLKGMKNLEILDISFTKVGDPGLVNLKNCKKLIKLNVNGTSCSPKQLAALHKLIPDCEIISSSGVVFTE